MATLEKNGLVTVRSGTDTVIVYPITKAENVDGIEEYIPSVTIGVLSASSWVNGSYSFESEYPSASYDLEISLDSTATASQKEAYDGAGIVGSAAANIVKAFGNVPTADIPIILKVVKK